MINIQGGLKHWECSNDLRHFLGHHFGSMNGSQVLELGCGLGECGSVCSALGASVIFQDYNESVVLELMQRLSRDHNRCFETMSFYCGDWSDLCLDLPEESVDVVIASEILYSQHNFANIVQILQKCLKPRGRAILATKNMYFGLSGSLYLFTKCIDDAGGFEYEIVPTNDSNIPRSILLIHKL